MSSCSHTCSWSLPPRPGFAVSGFLRDLASITASVLTVILVSDRMDNNIKGGSCGSTSAVARWPDRATR